MHQHPKLHFQPDPHAATRYKGKEIAKPITPPTESASEEDREAWKCGGGETVGGPVVQHLEYSLLTARNLVIYAKNAESQKRLETPRRQGKMLLCKQLRSYMAKIQEVPNADSGTDAEPLEQYTDDTIIMCFPKDLHILSNLNLLEHMCSECDDEPVFALAKLIANLKLDVDDNKKIQKQLKKANATLTQELTECKSILAETSRTLGESNSIRDSCLVALQNKQTSFESTRLLMIVH
ncbi:hypothetical protein Tco_1524659 [Tanacetum coccineum]